MSLAKAILSSGILDKYGYPERSLFLYEEEKLWKKVQPYGYKWKTKKKRPLIMVANSDRYVYFLLLTRSFIKCYKGASAYLSKDDLEVNLSSCSVRSSECRWLREECRLFRRKAKHGCFLVLRMRKKYLNLFHYCGSCGANVIPEKVIDIMERELEIWSRRDSGLS